jgi:demethylmenaquinone methyltransferase/2-methoxy-6-polyprenyl-1,4-benzoquinol methylase
MDQKAYFNNLAEVWDQKVQHDPKKIVQILDGLDIFSGHHVLDVGTGTGVLIPELAKRVGSEGFVKAVDISDRMIEVAQRKHIYPAVEIECADVLSMRKTSSFDHVICFSMFPHFHDQENAIRELVGHLTAKGRFTIAHSQSRTAINALHLKAGEEVKKDRLPTMAVLRSYYKQAGLKVVYEVDTEELFVLVGET